MPFHLPYRIWRIFLYCSAARAVLHFIPPKLVLLGVLFVLCQWQAWLTDVPCSLLLASCLQLSTPFAAHTFLIVGFDL